ncbi:MAG: Na/Pi cotransporter family protein, partial [Bacteroidales bacterium]|nr:Na/Pi cotransporter family protein [Bacteroidales bacterium]
MSFGIFDILELFGSLGVFLYGMKLMSEALQKVAGSKLRNILAAMTSSRIKGIFAGLLITAVIQSSSATTVMLVSFVNAGLLNLLESIGIIMGANIGTTVTAWIISILGFKVKMSFLSLPLIGITMPLLFSKTEKKRSLGEIVMGFAMIFIGLEYLKSSVPDIRSNPDILSFLSNFTDWGLGSYFIFLAIGTLLTIVIQSSSATMALTLVMCSNGWISFETAAAMVLGENIGTTITANIAATVANTAAKQTARAHLLFNVFGVFWMTLVFPFFLKGINLIVVKSGAVSVFETTQSLPIALSLFHTIFYHTNVNVLLPGDKLANSKN